MRKSSKYKVFYQLKNITNNFPTRILKFKRPKWLSLQKQYRRKYNSTTNLPEGRVILSNFKILNVGDDIERLSFKQKTNLMLKRKICSFYDKKINFRKNSGKDKIKTSFEYSMNKLIKPHFNLDTFLYLSKHYESTYACRQDLNNGKRLLNEKYKQGNRNINNGDVLNYLLTSQKEQYNFLNLNVKRTSNDSILSYEESDYYTKTAVIVKDLKNLSPSDLSLHKLDLN